MKALKWTTPLNRKKSLFGATELSLRGCREQQVVGKSPCQVKVGGEVWTRIVWDLARGLDSVAGWKGLDAFAGSSL